MCWRGLGRLSSVTDCAFSARSCVLGPLQGGTEGSSAFLEDTVDAAPWEPSSLPFSLVVFSGLPGCAAPPSSSSELLEGGAEERHGGTPPAAARVGRGGLTETAGLGGRGPMGRSGRVGFGWRTGSGRTGRLGSADDVDMVLGFMYVGGGSGLSRIAPSELAFLSSSSLFWLILVSAGGVLATPILCNIT